MINGPTVPFEKESGKLIYFHDDQSFELYNLEEDLSESNDLSEQRPDKTEELAGILTKHLKETNADMPVNKETGEVILYPDEAIEN